MNRIDQLIERKAYEYFSGLGIAPSLVEFKIKELQICIDRGYNSRAEILRVIKKAQVAA